MKGTLEFNLPALDKFSAMFPQYGNIAREDKKGLVRLVFSLNGLIRTVAASDLELPAVAGIARDCSQNVASLTSTDKQFVGALTCALLLANGYEKTGVKRSIPHPDWSKGEVYKPTAKAFRFTH